MSASAAETTDVASGSEPPRPHDRLRALHSLSGIVPVGFFLLEHVAVMASAMRGQSAFLHMLRLGTQVPFGAVASMLLIVLPLAFHGVYGLVLLANKDARADVAPYSRNWALASRVGALIALVFIGFHFYALRGTQSDTALIAQLSSLRGDVGFLPAMPWLAIFYLLGIAGTVTHFAIASWGFLVRRGYAGSPASSRRAAYGAGALGAVVFAISAATVISLATGAPLFPRADIPVTPCP